MPNLDSAQDLRLSFPETVWLEAEHFALANQISSLETTKAENSWQVYLNTLALLALESWLDDRLALGEDENRLQERVINREMSVIQQKSNLAIAIPGSLRLGDYKFCAIATEDLLNEIVNIPQIVIEQPNLIPHFYVLLEVLEEEEEVVIRGFLAHNQLIEIQNNLQLSIHDACYQIPLAYFDIEPNHLLVYYRYIQSSEFTVPAIIPIIDSQVNQVSENLAQLFSTSTTKLSQWLQGIINEGWQTIDSLVNPELDLAFSTRNIDRNTKRAKIIDLGIDLDSKKFTLLVNISPDISTELPKDPQANIIPDISNKINVLAQLYPLNGENFLPQNIKLILLSKAGKTLQEATARVHDNYIQLKPFKGETGKKFSIQVSLGDVSVKENFEL